MSKGRPALHSLTAIDPDTGRVNAVIDTPRGSRAKYKYNEKSGRFHLRKLLPLGVAFPYNFGFIPSTRGGDGDALDVLVILEEPLIAGCIVPVRLIGGVAAKQTEKGKTVANDRLIAVPETDENRSKITSLEALGAQRLDEIEHFFIYYNQMEGRQFKPTGRYGPDKAMALVKDSGA